MNHETGSSEEVFQAMYDEMYPTVTFREPTGNACTAPDCDCGGQGMEVQVVVVATADN